MPEPSASNSSPKTVFMVGAGASEEVDLPIGSKLTNFIAAALNIKFTKFEKSSGDDLIYEALCRATHPQGSIGKFLEAARRIYNGMAHASSIDDFMHSQSGDKKIELCGKLAIVRTILQREAKSKLFVDFFGNHHLDFDKLKDTWLYRLVQMLIKECNVSDLATRLRSIAFIIFNYDRCVEHYLYHAIRHYYGMNDSDVVELLHNLQLYHPYGTVGSLPWRSSPGNAIAFGDTPDPMRLLHLARQIKTFTEGTDESSSDVNSIRSTVKASSKLIFLGFAFHKMNIELLLPNSMAHNPAGAERIFATALGMSRDSTNFIVTDLRRRGIGGGDMQLRSDLTCSQLIPEYWHNMSFS